MSLLNLLKEKQEFIENTYKDFETFRDGNKSLDKFLEFLGFSLDQFDMYKNLETDFLDGLQFILKKKIKRNEKFTDLIAIFWEGCFTEEGKKFIGLLDEHVSTDFIRLSLLFNVFTQFQDESFMFFDMEGFAYKPFDDSLE